MLQSALGIYDGLAIAAALFGYFPLSTQPNRQLWSPTANDARAKLNKRDPHRCQQSCKSAPHKMSGVAKFNATI
jgi:hypothetical protein